MLLTFNFLNLIYLEHFRNPYQSSTVFICVLNCSGLINNDNGELMDATLSISETLIRANPDGLAEVSLAVLSI